MITIQITSDQKRFFEQMLTEGVNRINTNLGNIKKCYDEDTFPDRVMFDALYEKRDELLNLREKIASAAEELS